MSESGSSYINNVVVNEKNAEKQAPFQRDGENGSYTSHNQNRFLKIWYEHQFTIVITSLQVLFMVLMGIWGRYGNDELPGGVVEIDTINAQYPMFQDIHVMVFAGFGFLMTFLRRYGYSAVAINFLLAAFTIEWAVIVRGFIFQLPNATRFQVGLDMLIESDFIAATILISMGAMLGKLSPIQYLIMALIEVPVAIGIEHVVVKTLGVNDVGGSLTIHCFGAYFGMACTTAFAKKIQRNHRNEGTVYHSDIFSMIGTIFLWCFWPSFNAADVETETARQRAVANTYLSLVACTVTTFIVTQLTHEHKKFDMMHIANATLAGGVGVGTAANAILYPLDAMIVGVTVAIVSTLGFKFLTPLLAKVGIHDTCGVHNLHGMPAVVAGISSILFAVAYDMNDYGNSLNEIYPHMERHPDGSWNAQKQAVHQLLGLLIVWGAGLVAGAVTGFILRLPIWRQISDEELFADGEFFETPEDYEWTSKLSSKVENLEDLRRRIFLAGDEINRLPN